MTNDTPVGPVDATRVPRYAGPADLRPAAPHRRGVPRRRRRRRRAVRLRRLLPPRRAVRPRPHPRSPRKLLRPYNPALDVAPFAIAAGRRRRRHRGEPVRHRARPSRRSSAASDELRRGRHEADHPRRRPHHRAAAAAVAAPRPRPDRGACTSTPTWTPGTPTSAPPYTHGTPFRRAVEEGLLDPERCLHVGIRGPLYAPKDLDGRRGARLPGHPAPTTTRPTGVARGRRADARPARRRGRSTSPSTSTCSTRRTRPAPARPRRAA